MEPEILQLGAVAIIFLFAIKEFFSWQKSRKNGSSSILRELQLMNSNHLTSICKVIGSGDKEIVKAITDMRETLGDKIDDTNGKLERLLGRLDK